jgi:hypothetical protein
MLNIGDGVVGLATPKRHTFLWRFGPAGSWRATEAFAERPTPTRLPAAAAVGLGLGLALRQFGEE